MLRPIAFANSLAVVGAIFYFVCAILVAVAPDVYFAILQSWSHGLDLSVAKPDGGMFSWGTLAVGLVTFTLFCWISGALIAWLYGQWDRGLKTQNARG